jgi:hypothetical protein
LRINQSQSLGYKEKGRISFRGRGRGGGEGGELAWCGFLWKKASCEKTRTMENYESDIFMSQEGYASIDFTLLDRPNCNIASAPEATAALLPDVHVAESSFSSFDFLDGSGVDGLSGFSRGVDQNHSLELSRQVCFDNVSPMVFQNFE